MINNELLAYARALQKHLNVFTMNTAYHRVKMVCSESAVVCEVEIVNWRHEVSSGDIEAGMTYVPEFDVFRFENGKARFAKPARSYLWTARQAQQDAADLIGTVLSGEEAND